MFGIGLGVNVPSAPLREFYTPGQTKEPGRGCTFELSGIFDQLSILDDDQQKAIGWGFPALRYFILSLPGRRLFDHSSTAICYFSHHWESGPLFEAQIGWGFIEGFGKKWFK